jgi:hypothetical protein
LGREENPSNTGNPLSRIIHSRTPHTRFMPHPLKRSSADPANHILV